MERYGWRSEAFCWLAGKCYGCKTLRWPMWARNIVCLTCPVRWVARFLEGHFCHEHLRRVG